MKVQLMRLIGAPVERGGIMGEIWDEYLELHCERRSAQVGRMNYDRLNAQGLFAQ